MRDDERCGGCKEVNTQELIGKRLGLLCWSFKGVQQEIPLEKASTLQIAQWHFHQDNAPVHNSILVTDYLTKGTSRDFITVPIVQTLLPVSFGYSLSSQAVVMRQVRRWKRLWRRSLTRSHKMTYMGLPEVVGTVQQVYYSRSNPFDPFK